MFLSDNIHVDWTHSDPYVDCEAVAKLRQVRFHQTSFVSKHVKQNQE
jgi:hypothetical protein